MTTPPRRPQIYHIAHVDRLESIVQSGKLLCDAEMANMTETGTSIGMHTIKQRRAARTLTSHPTLRVGDCVPFYFCPRSVMLYVIRMANHPELAYRGGQEPVVHLEADLREAVSWAEVTDRRWAFTLSNAGSRYFEDRSDIRRLGELDWVAINARNWQQHKEGKQAEFLMEDSFSWTLVRRIGVCSDSVLRRVTQLTASSGHRPAVEVERDWYY